MKTKAAHLYTVLLIGSLFLFGNRTYAQQESQYTQYMYNTVSINPAYAGSRGSLSILGLYRNQWSGLDGAPETIDLSAHSPIGVQGVGAGLGFHSDKIGPTSKSEITADFSYTLPLNQKDLSLGFGLKGGVSLMDVDPNKLTIFDPSDYDLTLEHHSAPVFGLGFHLYTNNWYIGLSVPNVLETKYYDDVQVSTATEKAHFYLTGGYIFDISYDFKLKPAVLVKGVTGAPLAVDISANALLMNRLTLGLGYRLDADVSALAGFQITDGIMVGYSYDYTTTALRNYNDGSHEIFLRFELGTRLKPKVNPRFF